MRLRKLILEQFRNHQKLELDFDPNEPMTYIVGPNAQGKTNILESIYLLALTKSFRTTRQMDMIGWEYEYARVKGIFETGDAATSANSIKKPGSGRPELRPSQGEMPSSSRWGRRAIPERGRPDNQPKTIELEAFLGKPPQPQKAFKKNDVKTGAANFIGNCQVVFFHPEDLNMLYLGPDLRRAYLNVMNVQVNRKYFSALRSYQKVLKQRNALLHAIREQREAVEDLDVWDEQLVEHGSYLMSERSKTVGYFQKRLSETYRKISQGKESVKISYHHALNFGPSQDRESADQSFWHDQFAKDLAAARARDLQALVTTVGPHRDDMEFSFNGLKLAALASRGEYRSLLLALKLIELDFCEERTGEKPILLLDDVFSELDPERQNLLLQAIEGHQTIITATHLDEHVQKSASRSHRGLNTHKRGKHLEISQGKIHEQTA